MTAEVADLGAGHVGTMTVTSPSDAGRRLTAVARQPDGDPANVVVDLRDRRQAWWGTGAALTDASRTLLHGRGRLLDTLFSPTAARGARLTMLRLPLSSTDFSPKPWSWSWNGRTARPGAPGRAAVRMVRDEIRTRQPRLRVVGANWSAPGALKATGTLRGGDLRASSVRSYADLVVAQARWLRRQRVPLWATSLGNEPGYSTDYASMTMSDSQMSALARAVSRRLDRLGTQLWAVDHNWSDRGRVDTVLAGGGFDAAAFHCYGGSPSDMAGLAVPRLVTECTGTTDRWGSTFWWDARRLVTEAVEAGSSGLLMWNLALDASHGPVDRSSRAGCKDCRGLLTVSARSARPEPEFYTLAHLGRAAAPGARVVGVRSPAGVATAAFANPDGTVGVFGHNGTAGTVRLRIDVGDGTVAAYDVGPGELFSYRTR